MSFLAPDQAQQPTEPKIESAPTPVLAPQGRKPGNKNQRTTFLGTDATPAASTSGNMGGKTLLGM